MRVSANITFRSLELIFITGGVVLNFFLATNGHSIIQNNGPSYWTNISQKTAEPLSNPTTRNGRSPKLLSFLLNSEAMNCAPQLMCEMISAEKPGRNTDIINDYKYLIKEFFLKSDNSGEEDREVPQIPHENSASKRRKAAFYPSSSSEESEESIVISKPKNMKPISSSNDQLQDHAELMQLEEDDELDNMAIESIISTNPFHLNFGLAEIMKKRSMKLLASKKLNSFERNLAILRQRLNKKYSHFTLRNSRALQRFFFQRKEREVEATKDAMGRMRIAAEVGGNLRNARKCRSLFSSCPMKQNELNALARHLKQQKSLKRKETSLEEIVSILEDFGKRLPPTSQSAPQDLRIVVKIGPPDIYQVNTSLLPTPLPLVINNWTASAPISSTTPSLSTTANSIPISNSIKHKREYKLQLPKVVKDASQQIINSTKKPKQVKLLKTKQKLKVKMKLPQKSSKDSISKESNESSEEQQIMDPVLANPHKPKRILAAVPSILSRRGYPAEIRPSRSLMYSAYDIFFRDRRILSLPDLSSEWIPSAVRHRQRKNPDPPLPNRTRRYWVKGYPSFATFNKIDDHSHKHRHGFLKPLPPFHSSSYRSVSPFPNWKKLNDAG